MNCQLKNIAQTIIELSNSNSKIKYLDALSDDPMQRKPDLTLAYQKIICCPKIDIKT